MDTQAILDGALGSSAAQRAELKRGGLPAELRRRMRFAYGAFPSLAPVPVLLAIIAAAVALGFMPLLTKVRPGREWVPPVIGLALTFVPALFLWKLYRQWRHEQRVFAGRERLRVFETPVETVRSWNLGRGGAFKLRAQLKSGEELFPLAESAGQVMISGPVRLYVLRVPTQQEGMPPCVEQLVALEALPGTRVEERPPARPAPTERSPRSVPAD